MRCNNYTSESTGTTKAKPTKTMPQSNKNMRRIHSFPLTIWITSVSTQTPFLGAQKQKKPNNKEKQQKHGWFLRFPVHTFHNPRISQILYQYYGSEAGVNEQMPLSRQFMGRVSANDAENLKNHNCLAKWPRKIAHFNIKYISNWRAISIVAFLL